MDWQPIETAPFNVKVLAGYTNGNGKWRTVTACYHTRLPWGDDQEPGPDGGEYAPEGWYEESETQDTIFQLGYPPTHWMPLPPPPTGA